MANLSQQKRERMLAFLNELKKKNPDDDDTLRAIGEIENELNSKKYGLVWEQHEEAVDVKIKDYIPVFTEDHDREISAAPGEGYNFLLEGDNLHSLKLLEKTHKGKIDLIYIDPPYNTGNAFTYSDENVDLLDSFRHSKWLSFMSERLQIAHNLLSENGKIFVSIDDNEQANLKLLMDEVFGENNFFTTIIVQSNKRGQTYKQIAKTHEYILVYTKKPEAEFNEIEKTDDNNDLNLQDSIGRYNIRELRNRNPKFGRFNRPNLYYAFYVNPENTDKDGFCPVSLAETEQFSVPVFPKNSKNEDSCWRWGKELAIKNINQETQLSNVVAKQKKDGSFNIYEKYRKNTYKAKTIWFDTDMITEHGTVELGNLGLGNKFDFPKPVELIKRCVQLGSEHNSIILDFFAGSGTTAQAMLEQNREDGGNRHFILCTNNENNICENVTYPRVKTVITGIRPNGSKYSDGIPANLKYYKTDFVARNEEYLSDALLKHISEMIQLENGIKLDGKKYLMILTDEQADEISSHWDQYPDVSAIYLSKNVLLTTEQESLFENIPVYIIPDYYFDFELREEGESW